MPKLRWTVARTAHRGVIVDVRDSCDTGTRQPNGNWHATYPDVLAALARAEIGDMKLLPAGSNYVFVLSLFDEQAGPGAAIYKPFRGEAPLWDYPEGLYRRERATYLLSEALGWGIVPPTVLRDGPHGVGMVQLHIDHEPRTNYFTIRDTRLDDLRRMALFDVIANNGDRKGGHCLVDADNQLWGIDHGLTFHHQGKLRTVIWDFVGEPLPGTLLPDLETLAAKLARVDPSVAELLDLLRKDERRALCNRVEQLLRNRTFPAPTSGRPVPWPAL